MTTTAMTEVPERSEVSKPLAIQQVGFLRPTNLKEALEIAGELAKSEMVPKDYRNKPANIIVAMELGATVHLAPLQALQSIAVINGRPTIYGDAGLAIVQAHPAFEDMIESWEGTPYDDDFRAVVTIKRAGRTPVTRYFSVEDAKRAELWNRKNSNGSASVWMKYPKRMLQWRARWLAMRDLFPDALLGLAGYEEYVGEIIEGTAEVVEPSEPERKALTPGKHSVFDGPATETLESVLQHIAQAQSSDELKAIGERSRAFLSPKEHEKARNAAKERWAVLDPSSGDEQEGEPEPTKTPEPEPQAGFGFQDGNEETSG